MGFGSIVLRRPGLAGLWAQALLQLPARTRAQAGASPAGVLAVPVRLHGGQGPGPGSLLISPGHREGLGQREGGREGAGWKGPPPTPAPPHLGRWGQAECVAHSEATCLSSQLLPVRLAFRWEKD